MAKRESHVLYNGDVAAIAWQDKRPIYFLTTLHVSAPTTTVLRYDPKEHKRLPVTCPMAVEAYNKNMGGTDLNDQMTKLQKARRHYRWPRRLIIKFFLWSAYNAYVLMGHFKPHTTHGKAPFTFHMFIECLCESLVSNADRQATTTPIRRPTANRDEFRLRSDVCHNVERAAHATTNNRCVVCVTKYKKRKAREPDLNDAELPKRKKTVHWCTSCQEFLCVGKPDENCWYDWHNKVEFWR